MTWVRVAGTGDIVPGQCRALRVGTRRIAVWNVDGVFHAIEDACRHMKAPLSTGRLHGNTLSCAWHGWKYDVTTGACHDKAWGRVRVFPVKIEDGAVFVSDEEIEDPERAGPDEGPEEFPRPVFRS